MEIEGEKMHFRSVKEISGCSHVVYPRTPTGLCHMNPSTPTSALDSGGGGVLFPLSSCH